MFGGTLKDIVVTKDKANPNSVLTAKVLKTYGYDEPEKVAEIIKTGGVIPSRVCGGNPWMHGNLEAAIEQNSKEPLKWE